MAGDANQSPVFEDIDLYATDLPMREASARNGASDADLATLGPAMGAASRFDSGRLANEYPPRLAIVDAKGNRIDRVAFHPAWHDLMAGGIAAGLQGSSWEAGAGPAAQTRRAARLYMAAQAESGHICPLTMTHASAAALEAEPRLLAAWLPKIAARVYDPAARPWQEKQGVTIGMGMTERQGGTDVRANTTRAVPAGEHYIVDGEKWFMSAPMCDAFLVLAQAPGGLTCFLMPRFRPDGSLNGLRLRRLKDKLGNRSNASSEVEFHSCFAERVGPEGAGIRTIINMVQLTRLDCAVASAGLMRLGLASALLHCRHRSVFGAPLIRQPAMRAVLADMALEMEGVTALVFRLARAFDRKKADAGEAAYARLLTPAVKYRVCKAAPDFLAEAMECLGGNGYVEEQPLARAYREAPVNAIWEGSGNVMALDVLRAFQRDPDASASVVAQLAQAADEPPPDLTALLPDERNARRLAGTIADLAIIAELRKADPAFAAAWKRTGAHSARGESNLSAVEDRLIGRAWPGL